MNFDIKEVKIEIYIPEEYIEEIRNALTLAGACRAGNYDHVLSYQSTKGFWRPLENSHPFHGEKGTMEEAVKTVRRIHPYEEPVINVIPLLDV